ncbi:MAG: hypothetical protein KDA61_00680 [Planctomycetales bacterium]|nr:hypothetical protein [Planctomycetales bacterium]
MIAPNPDDELPDDAGSVSLWLSRLRKGDDDAADQLWKRYFHRLSSVAQQRLRNHNVLADGEDVALDTLKSAFLRLLDGRLSSVRDRTNLWPLLIKITLRKTRREIEWSYAQKRTPHASSDIDDAALLRSAAPSPEFAADIADELDHLFRQVDDEILNRIASLRLQGFTVNEISGEIGVGQRTVARKIARIRQEWLSLERH